MHAILLTRGTGGDLLPYIQIGKALKSRGHAVTLMTHAHYDEKVKFAGLVFAPIDQAEDFIELRSQSPTLRVQDFAAGLEQGLPSLLNGYEMHKGLFEAQDVVIVANHHTHLGAQFISEKHAVPVVSVFAAPHFVLYMPFWEQVYALASGKLNAIRTAMGLPAVQDWSSWWRGLQGYMGLWPEWFAAADASWPVAAKPVGFVMGEPSEQALPDEVERILGNPLPTVLITHATSATNYAQFFPLSIEACRKLGWQAIVVTPHRDLLPDRLPAGVYFYPFLPYFRCLLPRLKAIIHHGGIGTLAYAMEAGIPQLILGAGYDRPDNGVRAQRLGVAEFIPMPQWQVDAICRALHRLTHSPVVARQCKKLSAWVLSDNPMDTVCHYLEEVAAFPVWPHSLEMPQHRHACLPSLTDSGALSSLSDEERALLVMKLRQRKLAA